MAENKKQYDWFAALVQNPDLMINDFKRLGVNPDNSELKSRSEYEGMPQVQEAFKNSDGKFDKAAFDKFYDNSLLLYNNYANEEYVPKATELFGYLDSQWDRPSGSKIIDTTPRFSISPTAQTQSFGIDYINKYGQGPYAKQSAREIAQQQEVVDYLTGEGLGWTPDDKSNPIRAIFRPTLVLASWDEDGEHREGGELVQHKRGDLKYRNGLPYYETLGDRSLSGKQVLTYSDSLTREGSWLNKYDFFDSDGLDKNMVGTIAKTAFITIPYLIPGVGEILGATTAFVALNRVLPVLGKAIANIAGGSEDNEFNKTMNQYEGWFAKFDPSVSDNSQQHLVTFENLGNLISSVSGQLFQQRVVGSIPRLLNKSGDIVKQSEIGRALSYGYMSLTSAQDSYNTFKEAGASDMVAGWAFVANAIAIGGLMATDYGKGLLFKGSWLDENVLKAPAKEAVDQVRSKLTTGIENASPKEKAKFIQSLIDVYRKHFSSAAADTFINRGASEAIEEMMEEGVLDVSKVLTNVAQSIGINTGDKKLDFGLSWTDVLQRYGMAAAGGFIGGGIFHLQGKWDEFLANDMAQHTDEDTMAKLTYYIAQGRGQEIRDLYRQWYSKGLLGSTSLGTDLSVINSIDGSQTVSEPAGNGLSQNDVVFHTLMEYINTIENTISKEGLKIDTGSLVRNALIGYQKTDGALRGDTLINLGVHDLLIKDVYDVATKIVQKNAELQSEIQKLTVKNDSPDAKAETEENIKNSETVKRIQEELKQLRDRRDSILKGENNWKYIGQAIFASNPELAKNFIDLSKESYTEVMYGKKYSTLSDDEKSAIDSEYEEYMKDDGKNKVLRAFDVYLGLSTRYTERLQQEGKLLKGYRPNESRKVATEFQEVFFNHLKEVQETSQKYNGLVAKENKTDEDLTQIEELKNRLQELENKTKGLQQNAMAMLIHPSGDNAEIVSLLTKPILTPEESSRAFELVRQMYEQYAANKQQLNNDFEYAALVRMAVNDFLQTGNVSDKVNSWLDAIELRESDNGNDPGLWTSWLDETGLRDLLYDEDEDATNYNSPLLSDIKSLATTFLENLGINNQTAINAYNQIRQKLMDLGFSGEDINALLAAITPEYLENGAIKPITEFIQNIDGLRSQIKYSSFHTLLQDFASDILGERSNILDLIESEKHKLANSSNLDDYFIRNVGIRSDLEESLKLIHVLRGMIIGTFDKTNGSINAGGAELKLAELDKNTADILYRQSFDLENEIKTLLGISDMNGSRILRVHEEIDRHMRGRYIWTLINDPTFVTKFGEVFHTEDGPINIKQIAENLLQGRIDLARADSADPIELMKFEVAFETALFDEVSKTTIAKDTNALAKGLVSLFHDAWKMDTAAMSTSTEVITPYSLLSYLQLVLSVPAESFYTGYKDTTQAADSKFAPIYNQEMAIRHISAEIARPDLSNAILDELLKTVDVSKIDPKDTQTINWLKNLMPLKNFVIVPGGAGCGKTTAVAQNVAKMYANYDHEYVCLAPEMEQSENLAKSIGENIRHTNKQQFFKSIFGVDLEHYRKNEKTGHYELAEVQTVNHKLFDASKKLKVLFIDEVSLFTESELKLISDYAVQHGIIVVGLGDPVQNSAKVYTDETLTESGVTEKEDKKTWHSTGLEDCLYFGSSYLTASLRTSNLAKYDNFKVLSSALDNVLKEWRQQRELTFDALDGFVPDNINLHYFEDETKNLFYGEKIVDKNTDLLALANKYKALGKVTIITDDLKNYQNPPEGVEVKDYSKMQGMETDFVLVDVNFEKNNAINGVASKYAILRDLYTLSQRSRIGTVIKDNSLKANLNVSSTNSPEFGQRMIMDEQDIAVFKQRRGEILNQLPQNNNLYDYIYKFEAFVPPTPPPTPVTPTPVTPSPSTPPETLPSNGSGTPPPVNGPGTPPTQPSTPVPGSNPSGTPPALPPGNNPPPPSTPPVKPKSIQQSADNFGKRGSTQIFNAQFNEFLYGSNFRTTEQQNQNSILNWKARNGGQNIKIDSQVYRQIVTLLGSGIRTELPIDLEPLFMRILDNNANVPETLEVVGKLKTLLKTIPEIYVSQYDSNNRIITAIYRGDTDFIEIPIGFTRTSAVGRYVGKFKRNTCMKLDKESGGWMTIEQFEKSHPGLVISPDWGVITDNVQGFTGSTKNYLETNRGKVMIVMTDEPAYVPYLRTWHTRDGNWAISHYKDITSAGIQKPVNPKTILQFVTSLHYKNLDDPHDLQLLIDRGLWEDPTNIVRYLTGNELANLPTGADYYRVLNGRAYQALPIDRALLFMRTALDAGYKTPDYDNFLRNMTMFMHYKFVPNNRIDLESHGMILTNNDKSILVKAENDQSGEFGYGIYEYDGSYDPKHPIDFIKREIKFPYGKICKKHLGVPNAFTEFVRFITINNNESMQHLSSNDNIYTLFGIAKYNLDELSDKMIHNPNFINGIYANDPAGDQYDPTSAFRRFIGNKSGYWIKGNVTGGIWSIDESMIQPITTNPQNDPIKQELDLFNAQFERILNVLPEQYKQKWRDKYQYGSQQILSGNNLYNVITGLVNGIHNNMKFTYDSWIGYELVNPFSDNPSIKTVNNLELWLDRRTRSLAKAKGIIIDDSLHPEFGTEDLEKWGYATVDWGNDMYGVLTKTKTGYEYFKVSKDSADALVDVWNETARMKSLLKPFESYIHSLLFVYKTSNKINPIGLAQLISKTPELSEFSKKLNNYLEQRLINNEC